ncbi:MAG: 23S rRNA (pseudouridine(1915)-N(3))-methyltransferase RlmH [Clostridia bacterium]|nr:23S rRNA (pseudouridine(1915)-N(3))-methyltransferase RlmH [Clostridia bacterium]
MKIRIVCVGKVKESYFSDGIAEYLKRLTRFAKVEIIEVKEENFAQDPSFAEMEKIKEKEGASILKSLKGHVVALCVEGKQCSSEALAEKIAKIRDSVGELTFVIGGSYGLADEVKKQAAEKLSFSQMTFPHTLMRLILTEQLYRAFMIDAGSTYHK